MDFKWVILEVLVILLAFVTEGVAYKVLQSSNLTSQNGPENAVNNDDTMCAVTKYGPDNYWRIQFNQTFTIKSVELRLKGGHYTIEVRNSPKENSDRLLCASKHLAFPSSTYTVNVACKRTIHGDIIIVHRTDSGSLTLCDFELKVCELSSHDVICPMCTVDTTCRHCDQFHYGDSCEHYCSPGCVPGSCDELTGECNCTTGFKGTHCQSIGVFIFVGYKVLQSSLISSLNHPENAVDNDDTTCAVTEYGVGNYWRIQFNQTLTVKSVELRLKGGNYTIEVRNSSKENSDRLLCASKHLAFPSSTYTVNVACKPTVRGNIIVVQRTDSGSLTLCDFKLKVCKLSSYDVMCPMCASDSTCRHCDQFHYGDSCEHNCSPGCVPGSCDELTGKCNCITGFTGTHCQLKD